MPEESDWNGSAVTTVPSAAATAEREAIVTQLHSVIDHAPIVLWAVDHEGRFTLSEGRGLKALGLSPGQVIGMSAFRVYAANPEILDALHRALNGEDVEVIFTEGGRTFENRIVPLRRAGNRVLEILGVSIDVTERYEAERERASLQKQLLQVQKLESLGLLAGGIAHDFNNILTIIEGSASLAQLSLEPGVPAYEEITNVLAAARRAADLTRQLLAYSGRAHFEIRALDLSHQIRELATLLEVSVPKRVDLHLELASALPAIEADVAQLQQVIMNLVINAAEAIGSASGRVSVVTGTQDLGGASNTEFVGTEGVKPGPYVFMEVQDTGAGMDDLTQTKIFDPFFTTKFTGRGLGLASVLGIVRAHAGALSVHSVPGHGTSFKVFFPAHTGPVQSATQAHAATPLGGGLALLVDDDAAVRAVTRRMLERLGFSVLEAENGQQGLARFRARSDEVRVVILDMTMPGMSGEETLQELKKLRSGLPALLVSGYNEQEAANKFTGQRQVRFLQKPFAAKDFSRELAATLALNELQLGAVRQSDSS